MVVVFLNLGDASVGEGLGSGEPLRGVPSRWRCGIEVNNNDREGVGKGEGTETGEGIGRETMSDKGMRKAEESAFCRLH